MIISVFNVSNGIISDGLLQTTIRAINVQIERDFEPYWGFGATLRLEGHTGSKKPKAAPYSPLDMRGDAILYVWDKFNKNYDGLHEKTFESVPYGVVYLDVSQGLGESWSATLSHEALELVGDPLANLVVQGPHPKQRSRDVFHWFEMCDAVQAQSYTIDNVTVSDFILPMYFTPQAEKNSRNNFLGDYKPKDAPVQKLKSFGVTRGGYIGFFDPHLGKTNQYELPDDTLALNRQIAKSGIPGRRLKRSKNSNFGATKKT